MPLIHTKDDIWLDIEEGLDPQGPEARALVEQERNRRFKAHMDSPEGQALIEKQRAADAPGLDPTSGMNAGQKIAANLGAGFTDLGEGIRQLRTGDTQPYRDKVQRDRTLSASLPGGRLLQGAGQAIPLAGASLLATAAAPAAAVGTAGGAVLGGLTGLVSPTESEDVSVGKGLSTGIGALTGGLGNKYLPTILPKAAEYAQQGLSAVRDFGRRFTEGGRQKIAENLFRDVVDDKPATIAALRRHRDVPGTMPTTGQVTGNRALLETERKIANTGGEGARELGQRAQASNKARYEFMADEFKGDPAAARQAASDFAEANKPKTFTQPFRPQPVLGEITRLKNLSSSPKVHAMLDEIADRVRAAAASKNPVEQLHQVRMFELDDKLSQLATTDRKLAGAMRRELMGVKKALDNQMDRATDGGWKAFLSGYEDLARVADQTEAGSALMTKVNQAAPDVGGTPSVSSVRQSVLRKESPIDPTTGARGPALDDFGNPRYSDMGQATIDDVLQSLDVAARREGVRPAGSATAANIAQPQQQAEKALAPMMGQPAMGQGAGAPLRALLGGSAGAGMGAALGGPGGAALGGAAGGALIGAGEQVLVRQSTDIAKRLLGMYADPGQAMMALRRAVQAGQVPFKLASYVEQAMKALPPGGMAGGAGALAPTIGAQQPAQGPSP